MKGSNLKGPSLGAAKRREICAILAIGCSRRTAARYVGCTVAAIEKTAARDEVFRQELERAEQLSEIGYMQSIQQAAKKSQYWRAAAWALERRNPEDYSPRRAGTLTIEQVRQLLARFAEIVVEEVSATQQKKVLNRLKELTLEYDPEEPGE